MSIPIFVCYQLIENLVGVECSIIFSPVCRGTVDSISTTILVLFYRVITVNYRVITSFVTLSTDRHYLSQYRSSIRKNYQKLPYPILPTGYVTLLQCNSLISYHLITRLRGTLWRQRKPYKTEIDQCINILIRLWIWPLIRTPSKQFWHRY